jgi:hypothetical protein
MTEQIFQQEFAKAQYVSALSAGASEAVVLSTEERGRYQQLNQLLITNRDAVDLKVILNGDVNITGNIFEVQAGATLSIDPNMGVFFSWLTITNLDSSTACTANKSLVRMGRYTLVNKPSDLGVEAKIPGVV